MKISEERKAELLRIESSLEEFPFPPQVVVETTSRCNFVCKHCSHKEMKRPRRDMDDAVFRKIIDEIAAKAPETEIWPTFYGEALLLKERLFELLAYARQAGCRNIVLNSNGSLLKFDWAIDGVLNSGMRRFILSLDGFKKETFERIRKGGNRDHIFASVEKLLKRRKELGVEYPVIHCQFSVMEENRDEVEEFKRYWLERGAEVKTRVMLSWTGTGSVVAPNLDYETDFRIACPWGNASMAIHQNGDVVACAVDYEGRFVAGNVMETSIEDIWRGRLYEGLRRPHKEHRWNDIPGICQGCRDWQAVGARYHDGVEGRKEGVRPFWHEKG